MTLADLGADVIKIERPVTGDTVRHAAPAHEGNGERVGAYFANVNRNKRSLALDLKSDADRERLLALAQTSDVVVENFRPGTADRLGVGYAALRTRNPRIVYCALTGYGQTGPLAPMPGHDLNIAGLAGMLQMTPEQTPAMPNVLMGDYAGGTSALAAILAGLFAARVHGVGSYLDVAMLDALSSWSGVHMAQVFAPRGGGHAGSVEGWGGNPRYNLYRTRDGRYVTVSLLEKDLWARFCRAFGREDLVNPAETEADRLTGHGERSADYRAFIAHVAAGEDRDALAERCRALDLPICPVYTPDEWYASDAARARQCFVTQHHPALGRPIPELGFPFRMTMGDGGDAFALRRPPPALDDARADLVGTGSR
jgi:crotonobetainyl-CoA:carnitine CoA-transferase CaiB-like acyl-CoA transferase